MYLYLKGDYQYAHFTITAGANSFSPQTTVSSTTLSAVYGTDVFAQLYPSSFNVNIGAVSSTSVTQIYEYQPDAMNGCMIYYYAYESSQQGELQMIVKNSNGAAALAIMSGETSYWGAQTLCLTGYIPPGGSAVLYGKQLASSFM